MDSEAAIPGSPQDDTTPDWNALHREHHAARGRKMALALIGISVLLFAIVAVVVVVAG